MHEATPEDLKAIDVYSALSSMPKYVDPDHDPFEGVANQAEGSARADTLHAEQKSGKRKAKELTQREQARMKKKQAVLAKLQEQAQTTAEPESGASAAEPERDSKKAKATEDEVN